MVQEFSTLIENEKLLKSILKLKEKERKILFARVFSELSFVEMGEMFSMEPKQAEMSFYYVIRKIRKGMGDTRDGF